MKHDNFIEPQLWDYIDNTCTNDEKIIIESNIRTMPNWAKTYEELMLLHDKLNALTPEEPSLRFTQNVMEKVTHIKPYTLYNYYLNKYLLNSIGWFFIVSIAILLIYSLLQIDWNFNSSNSSQYNIIKIDWNRIFDYSKFESTINIFYAIDLLLGLLLLDKWLHLKKRYTITSK